MYHVLKEGIGAMTGTEKNNMFIQESHRQEDEVGGWSPKSV